MDPNETKETRAPERPDISALRMDRRDEEPPRVRGRLSSWRRPALAAVVLALVALGVWAGARRSLSFSFFLPEVETAAAVPAGAAEGDTVLTATGYT